MDNSVHLEPAAQKVADDTAKPPFIFELPPKKGRQVLDELQSSAVTKPEVKIEDLSLSIGGPTEKINIRIVRPPQAAALPTILYLHGGGWVLGNAHTHDLLIRRLSVGSGAAVVFVNYSLSPETRYPTAMEECYTVLKWIAEDGAKHGLNPRQIIVAGDSAGGNLAIALTLLAKQRKGPELAGQLLFYPVTDANFETPSYRQFAAGYFLARDGMKWFWDQYAPDELQRAEATVSPLRAKVEHLKDLPPALVITAEADVLRDEGEAYANKLRNAGVPVTAARFQGIIHDFVMLNPLAKTNAATGALALASCWIKCRFKM